MGTWGTGLFSDDITADLRGDFRDYIGDGLTAQEATEKLVEEYRPNSDPIDLEPPFWLALASVQWSLGCLLPDVRKHALYIIESGADLRRWEDDPQSQKKRAGVLAKLKEQLESPPPAAKKVPRRIREENDWPVGAVFRYRLTSGNYCLFLVSGHMQDKGGRYPRLEVLDWYGHTLPPRWRVHLLRRRRELFSARDSLCGMMLFRTRSIEKGRLEDTGMTTWVRGREVPYLMRIRPHALRDFIFRLFRIRSAPGWCIDSRQLDDFLHRHCGFE